MIQSSEVPRMNFAIFKGEVIHSRVKDELRSFHYKIVKDGNKIVTIGT